MLDDDIPTQTIWDLIWGYSTLDLILMNKDELITKVKINGCQGASDHDLITFVM